MSTRPPRGLIAVDGIDGSGKSVLANRLVDSATAAGIATVLLRVDDFRRPVDWRGTGRSEAEIYYDDYYDLPLLDRCLQAFGEGAPSVDIPTFDSILERLDGNRTIAYGGATLAIVEGVFTLRVSTLSAGATVIHLLTSFPEAHRRIVNRDTARGRSLADVTHRITARYFPSQERYLRDLDPRSRADVIVDNEQLGAPRIVRFERERLGSDVAGILGRALGDFASPRRVE